MSWLCLKTLRFIGISTKRPNINQLQVLTDFEVGRRIVEEEQKGATRAAYGKQMLVELVLQLTAEFGRGFSATNLEYMRKFYRIYQLRTPRIPRKASEEFVSDKLPFLLS